ncbi:MAG: hypothetical protein JZU53_13385 [Paludibacter sp.]|nr:hypothetical protein [Paludibacter sp.]
MRKGNWTNGMKTLRFLGFAFSFVCVLMLIIYFFHFNGKFAEKSADWANFGSYFGSITGLMAFLAVLFTAIQSEKRANKAETKTLLVEQEAKIAAKFAKQEADKREAKANEQAVKREERDLFFNMLKMYHRQADLITKNKSFFEFTKDEGLVMLVYIIYDSILKDKNFKLSDDPKILLIQHKIAQSYGINADNLQISREEIAYNLKERIESLFKEKDFSIPNVESFKDVKFNNELNIYALYVLKNATVKFYFNNYIFNIMKGIADMIYIENEDQLGQYFRTVYYILETISTNIEKEKYSKIFRSQLSKYELILLLFNMVSSQSTLETLKLYKDNDIFNNINSKDLMLYKLTKVKYNFDINEFTNMLFNEYEKQQL